VGTFLLLRHARSIVGELYNKGDERRDGAFTLFYVGINLGAFAGSLAAGYLGETYGWKYGFGLAGIGMLAGLLVFVWGKPMLNGAGEPPNPEALTRKRFGLLTVGYILYRSVFTLKPHARNRIFAAMFLISIQVLFWGLFEQAGSSLTIFTDESVDRNILGTEVKTSVFQSLCRRQIWLA